MEMIEMQVKIGCERLKYVVDAASRLTDEGTLEFTGEGMRIREMDPSQIAMVDAFIPKKVFLEYPVEEPVEVKKFGVNLKLLKQIISKAKGDMTVSDIENKLKLEFGKKVFSIGLLDLSANIRKVPKVEGSTEFKISPGTFFEWVGDVELASSHIIFKCVDGKLLATGMGDAGEVSDDTGLSCAVDSLEVILPISFLKDMNLKAPTEIDFFLKKNSPVRLEYRGKDEIIVNYWLAPRIEPG